MKPGPRPSPLHSPDSPRATPPRAILFDRDDTLIVNVPYLTDPAQVRPMPGAVDIVAAVRAAGIRTGVVSNQSGVGRGWIAVDELSQVNARVDDVFGPFDTWQICPHAPDAGCECRKPRPGLVLAAAAALGVQPSECVVIGDIGADVGAALAAGADAVLVPTPVTRAEEIAHAARAARVAPTLADAVASVLPGLHFSGKGSQIAPIGADDVPSVTTYAGTAAGTATTTAAGR